MHILPQLRKLEEKYPLELVVVGVHAGKFHTERITANIRQAVLRLEIEHPVVNDRQFRVWRAYNVNAWPTLAFIDPTGHYVDTHAGEVRAEDLAPVVQKMIVRFEEMGRLDRRPLAFRLERESEPERPLAFPGKVHAADGNRIFIADSNHNRILAVSLSPDGSHGRVEHIIGSGRAGLADGGFSTAAFHRPQGLALSGEILYVADTENHAIRAVDLSSRQVKTIAGTGEQARRFGLVPPARGAALNSPWDILVRGDTMYIAMAGAHQIWAMDLARGEIGPYAGNGWEAINDGPLRESSLAQPSGLASDGRRLFFADSESSAVRWLDLTPGGRVHTIVGTGLFDFGDKDGMGEEVRLQHSYGLAWHDGRLYVADTYNNKIKIIGPDARAANTLLGTGEAGWQDGERPLFYEPEGLAGTNGRLYIADTNNHRIRIADLQSKQVTTLVIEGL
ncbi:MAG: alkyl hydroperoxide reductase [Bacteroidetes bacterium]|nr:alkyl hydroperoxide reductase [Bacteroidota bacterium]